MSDRRAVVVGAGISGLTAAVALYRHGWEVTVFERAAEQGLGAGIVLAPNALRALGAIGFDVEQATGSAVPAAMGVRLPNGQWLHKAGMGAMAERYGSPPLAVHRAALAQGLAAELPAGALRFGTSVREVLDAADTPFVRTDEGDVQADVVIAADGIHSPLRRQYFPAHCALHYSGETAWRTVISAEGLPDLVCSETWGRRERFGIVPLADGRVYVYASAFVPQGTRPADAKAELIRRFGRWHAPVPAMLERLDPATLLQHDLFDLAGPLPRLHHGKIAWIGDAAHAMTPNLGQGGCQAIEDAVVLAHLLHKSRPDGIPEGLAAYSTARWARTDAIRLRSRKAGRVAGLSHPLALAARNLAARATPPFIAFRALDDLYKGFSLPA
ncbi:FAD-dependent monooxygenase [Streptomyces actinomycinicus]|uniref:FAD-dependent monooxygenase n=1 Tax=Streptomyces actinomycinicus TaxID=1695166 RepID=A0A937ERU2_9ACTN|nr:FAD-dependent oxidoreductase [Streptomyces actinomycinicus]MBL1087300.1 FAD-dependent monooxygenase [Streptomyces actinomycinicus]